MTQDIHEPVAVLKTSRDDDLALAKSMLMSADIPFCTKNEWIADLFGCGRFGGVNLVIGPMELLVAPRDADDAQVILSSQQESLETGEDVPVPPSESVTSEKQSSSDAKSPGLWGSASRAVQTIAIIMLIISAVSWALVISFIPEELQSLDNYPSLEGQPSYLSFGSAQATTTPSSDDKAHDETMDGGWVKKQLLADSENAQGVSIVGSGAKIPAAYQKLEDRFMSQTPISVKEMIGILSELSADSSVDDVMLTLPGSSAPLSIQEAIVKLSKMPPSHSIQVGSLSWCSDQ